MGAKKLVLINMMMYDSLRVYPLGLKGGIDSLAAGIERHACPVFPLDHQIKKQHQTKRPNKKMGIK